MSQINRFYINKPNNFTELIIYKLYGYSLIKLFAKYESKLVITVINNSNYKTEKELTSIMKNIEGIENRKIILNYDDSLRENLVPNNQEYAFKDYKNPNTIKDTFLSYDYDKVSNFIYKITEHYIDIVKTFKKLDIQYDKIFENKMNIIQQLSFKGIKFITLNLDTYNDIVMPDMYYIKALAVIFNTLKLKDTDMKNIKIIVTYNSKINEKAYSLFVKNISKHLKLINIDNFISYKEINKFYSQFGGEEFIFYLNMFHFPTICSQNPNSLIPVFLKDNHKTLDWDLYDMNIFSKKLFANTLISRSFGI